MVSVHPHREFWQGGLRYLSTLKGVLARGTTVSEPSKVTDARGCTVCEVAFVSTLVCRLPLGGAPYTACVAEVCAKDMPGSGKEAI